MRLDLLYKANMVSSPTKAISGSYNFQDSALAIAALSMPTLTLKHKELDGIFTSVAALHADIHSQEEPLAVMLVFGADKLR